MISFFSETKQSTKEKKKPFSFSVSRIFPASKQRSVNKAKDKGQNGKEKELLVFKHEASLDGVHASIRRVPHRDLKSREYPRGERREAGEPKGKSGRSKKMRTETLWREYESGGSTSSRSSGLKKVWSQRHL